MWLEYSILHWCCDVGRFLFFITIFILNYQNRHTDQKRLSPQLECTGCVGRGEMVRWLSDQSARSKANLHRHVMTHVTVTWRSFTDNGMILLLAAHYLSPRHVPRVCVRDATPWYLFLATCVIFPPHAGVFDGRNLISEIFLSCTQILRGQELAYTMCVMNADTITAHDDWKLPPPCFTQDADVTRDPAQEVLLRGVMTSSTSREVMNTSRDPWRPSGPHPAVPAQNNFCSQANHIIGSSSSRLNSFDTLLNTYDTPCIDFELNIIEHIKRSIASALLRVLDFK